MPSVDNIWDAAIALSRQKRSTPSKSSSSSSSSNETSLLILGSKGSGKSTLIYRLLERQEAAKPTLALEYTYWRKSAQNINKDVCHIWELGGGTLFTNLLETPLSPSKLPTLKVVLVVDLSEPHQLWFTLETLISSLQGHITKAIKTAKASGDETFSSRLEEALNSTRTLAGVQDHPDYSKTQPLSLPLVIMGGKYDLFADMEPEKKKIVCRALRYFTHHYGATLQFYSAKDSGLVKKVRDLLSHQAFGSDPPSGMSQDYNKPLLIPAWSDSFQAILGGGGGDQVAGAAGIDVMKHHFTTHFPQSVDEHSALGEDPAKDPNFREPEIDKLRAQKDEDLERYRKDMERRARQWADEFDQSVKM